MADTPFTVRVRAAVIEQTERTRSSSKTDIEESESNIASLESLELREREHACVVALRYLISPICTLPVELLAEIFDLAIHDDTHIKDAFRVSQVCSDWRRLAHGTPRLWNRNFRVRIPRIEFDDFYADGLKDWLAHSAPLPLESLEALALSLRKDTGSVLAFTVPRLRKLSLHISDALPILSLPWAQLADFTFTCPRSSRPDIAFDLLAQCPNLVQTSVFAGPVLPGAARDALSLSHLRSLYVYYFEPAGHATGHGASFLDNLLAPVLEELYLDFGKLSARSPRWEGAHFPAFQLRTPNITGLELRCSTITPDELKDVLSHTTCLERLTLEDCRRCFDETFIDALHYKDGVTPLVPHLHSLVLKFTLENGLADIMASVIASRWWTDIELASNPDPPAVARWTLVRVEGFLEPHFVNIMAGLQRKGIPVKVSVWEY
ncbi:hypothetical protein DFH08DRAFT_1071912 [Mycena albidolilacea]|uniref:F-box domain-containing protein n=1 Tax=Mycena albidolilacea TaxID=1033008 RepID=A0AAD7ARD8_9AGAR|nr:hypothetical protein DFH08DRAFT_1071912 [Mycena albidolilacea]